MTLEDRWAYCPVLTLAAASALMLAACGWTVLPIGSQEDDQPTGGTTAGTGGADPPAAGSAAVGGEPAYAGGGAGVETTSTGGAALGGSSSGGRSSTGGTPSGGASTGGRGTGGEPAATGGADTGGKQGTGGADGDTGGIPSTGGSDPTIAGATGEGGAIVQGGSGGLGNSAGQAGSGGSGGSTGGAGGGAGAPACEDIGDLTCQTDADCCLVMDECGASLALVTSTYADQMRACFADLSPSMCPSCTPAAVQTWCDNGQCVGQVQADAAGQDPLRQPHCGRLDASGTAGVGNELVPAPAGAPLRKFGCG